MQADDDSRSENDASKASGAATVSKATPRSKTSAFAIPPPLKRLFDHFPLFVYPPNELPQRSPTSRERAQNALYVFTTAEDAALEAPSYNPGCLKWQTFLKFHNIRFRTVPSNNHASPSGALPFLLPATSQGHLEPHLPIPASKLESWATSASFATATQPTQASHVETPYHALLTHPVRLAYLYALYIHPQTFLSTTSPRYVATTSTSALVRAALEGPLRAAALNEIISASSSGAAVLPSIDVERLIQNADAAFDALSAYLGDSEFFSSANSSPSARAEGWADDDDLDEQGSQQRNSGFGLFDEDEDDRSVRRIVAARPGMLDAAVFAYTHVLLELLPASSSPDRADHGKTKVPVERLAASIARRTNLLKHRERILRNYFALYHEKRWGGGRGVDIAA